MLVDDSAQIRNDLVWSDKISKKLICELPSEFCELDKDKDCRFRNLLLCGKRYAFIYPKNSNSFVLNMNGSEIEGEFEYWFQPVFCGMGLNWKLREETKYKSVRSERSLTTFTFNDKDGQLHTYIDGIKSDDELYKTHPTIIKDGLETFDTSIYILRKGDLFDKISNLFFKGVKGPDFHSITSFRYYVEDSSFTYVGESLNEERTKYAVIDGEICRDFPISPYMNYGYINKSQFGDTYFKYRNDQSNGYWVNGKVFPCEGRPYEISFSTQGNFKFICKNNNSSSVLITLDSTSKEFRFIGFMNESQADIDEHKNMIIVDRNTIYYYQNDKIIYSTPFDIDGDLMHLSFSTTKDKKTIVVKGTTDSKIHQRSFFGINNKWFFTKTIPPDGNYIGGARDLSKFLGFSETGEHYAYQEYVMDEETKRNKWANIYINDTLLGKFPSTTVFNWTTGDTYYLNNNYGEYIANKENGTQFQKDSYKSFIDRYYPDSVPAIIDSIQPYEIEVKELPNGERYIKNIYGVLIRGKQLDHRGQKINVGVFRNNQIYHTRQTENKTWLYVDFKLIYASDKIFSIATTDRFLSWHSYEGNSVYRLKYFF